MHVTDLPINKALGMQPAPEGNGHILEMPASPLHLNHVGTVHASVQFAMAEATSGEFLLRHLGEDQHQVFAVLRNSEVKFRKPAHGTLRASARFADGAADSLATDLSSGGRALTAVLFEIADTQGVVTLSGEYEWFLERQPNAA